MLWLAQSGGTAAAAVDTTCVFPVAEALEDPDSLSVAWDVSLRF
jgi:hypothetical protein